MAKCKGCEKEFTKRRKNQRYCDTKCKNKTNLRKKYDEGYHVYQGIIKRCTQPENNRYHVYGGRGIVCEFEDFDQFKKFYRRHKKCQVCESGFEEYRKHLHRIDNDGNYTPSNLVVLCGSCHSKLHTLQNKTGLPQLVEWYIKYLKVAKLY